jgi:hypothetical protein
MHNLYSFFKDTLTVPKIKDMVKRPQQRYDTLFRELRNQVAEQPTANDNASANDDMKNELKRYLMDLNASATQQIQTQSQPQIQTQMQSQPQPQTDFIESGSIY